jgi:GGDEF domain-containing protein
MNPRSADRLARAARAARTLSETLWEALHEELADPRGQRIAELSRRLEDVSATVGLLARTDTSPPPAEEPAAAARSQSPEPEAMRGATPAPGEPESHPPTEPRRGPEPGAPPASRAPGEPRGASSPRESPAAGQTVLRAVLVDELAPDSSPAQDPSTAPDHAARVSREIEIRDERSEEPRHERGRDEGEQDAWVAAIARRLERYRRDRIPFAVLLVELADVERLRHAELPGEVSRLTGLVEAALTSELRPADSLTRESPGRYWLLAPETDADSSGKLAERLASAVRGAASHRGVPLEVAVGVAVCPRDGARAATLSAHAEIALYAARAEGRPIV